MQKSKAFFLLCSLMLMCLSEAHAGKMRKYTADYYKLHSDKYIDQAVRVYVAYLKPYTYHGKSSCSSKADNVAEGDNADEGEYKVFFAHSYYKGDWGGSIKVYVPKAAAERYARKYGMTWDYGTGYKVKSKPLKGIFKSQDGQYVIYAQ